LERARWHGLFELCKNMRVRVQGGLTLELLGADKFSPPVHVRPMFGDLGVRVCRFEVKDHGSLVLKVCPGTRTMLDAKLGCQDLVRLVLEFHGLS
jgi:hypothetical protein